MALPEALRRPAEGWRKRLYLTLVLLSGAAATVISARNFICDDIPELCCYLAIVILASGMKVSLPGITGTMSVNFLFILVGIVQMDLGETIAIAWTGALVQMFWKPKSRPDLLRVAFNLAIISTASATAWALFHGPWLSGLGLSPRSPIPSLFATIAFFFLNTVPVAGIVALVEKKPILAMWRTCYFWSFPYYLAGAFIAWLVAVTARILDQYSAVLVLPVIFFVYRSYRQYLGRLDAEKRHAEDMARLHLRTIEALALAIEAKDNTTHDHLRRVTVYAEEIGRELQLDETQLQALRTAALLHDIGKLAVPEHIISKPGRLTPDEFEKMKIHPIVGQEILERVQFPYPVVPIVRSHHEKWDGAGYPDGLAGEQIPIGARILAAVDCLDALASDRQYRAALPLDDAIAHVVSESGKSFDPAVVEILARRYVELEALARERAGGGNHLSKDVRVEKGEPATGFATPSNPVRPAKIHYLDCIAAARQEVQLLFELTRDLGNSLSIDETISLLAVRIRKMIPYDTIAVWIRHGDRLAPHYVNGDDFRFFNSLEIPAGQGLSGWVAENGRAIVNGNPAVEAGYLGDSKLFTNMRSALAVPLQGLNGGIGVLTLYAAGPDFFTRDHLRVLNAVGYKVALSLENALKYNQVENSATTDFLTGLPNARSLFLHLDELAQSGARLGLLVCDLDGFKQINDRFGHLEGNRILKRFADDIRNACRDTDYVARMGGDEFVMILKDAGPEVLAARARELHEIARAAGFACCGVDWLGASAGCALLPEDEKNAEKLLSLADQRMYESKRDRKRDRLPSVA